MDDEAEKNSVYGWMYRATHIEDYEVGIDSSQKHSGSRSAYVKSIVKNPRPFGNLMQTFVAENHLGTRLRMRAWVKTKLEKGTAQLWVRIDGEWNYASIKSGSFDNMDDRPIQGTTKWTEYNIVVDVPKKSTKVVFGLMLVGKGQIWLDDVSFEQVPKTVALTGAYTKKAHCGKIEPVNLTFEDDGPLEFAKKARKFKRR